jgi:hypothetical protein
MREEGERGVEADRRRDLGRVFGRVGDAVGERQRRERDRENAGIEAAVHEDGREAVGVRKEGRSGGWNVAEVDELRE